MKEKISTIFNCLAIVSILFLGQVGVGGLSLRNVFAAILFINLIMRFKEIEFSKECKLYIAFVCCLLFASTINGITEKAEFWTMFIYHAVCIVLLLSIPLLIKNRRQIIIISVVIGVIYILNAIVSDLQFRNNPIGWGMGYMVTPGAANLIEDQQWFIDSNATLLNRSIVMGLMGFSVANGYFCATALPMVSYSLAMDKKFVYKIIGILFLVLGLYVAYVVQERMAMAVVLLYIVFLVFTMTRSKGLRFIFLLAAVFLYIFYSGQEMNSSQDLGRLADTSVSDDIRTHPLQMISMFAEEPYFMFGVPSYDIHLFDLGHNSITDTLRRGGIFTFIVFLVFFIYQVWKCIRTFYDEYRIGNYLATGFSISAVLYLGYSMTHSTGVQNGAALFWFFYVMMQISKKITDNNKI